MFQNHSCAPNCKISYVRAGIGDNQTPDLAVFTCEAVSRDTELTLAYFDISLVCSTRLGNEALLTSAGLHRLRRIAMVRYVHVGQQPVLASGPDSCMASLFMEINR